MPINVIVEPFTARGAAQRQGNILAEKAPCFYGSAAIVCVGYLVVQRACTTQQFCRLESGGAAILVLLRFEGAPSTFESAQPMNSKRYDPFFRGIKGQFNSSFLPMYEGIKYISILPYMANYLAFCPIARCKCNRTASSFVGISKIKKGPNSNA